MQSLVLAALLAAVSSFAAQKTVVLPAVQLPGPSASAAPAAAPTWAPSISPSAALPLPTALPAALPQAAPRAQAKAEKPSAAAQAAAAQPKTKESDLGREAFDGWKAPRVAVIGGGIAGLTAVHELAKHGVNATVYEADARTGGRVKTRRGPGGLAVDAGAEFVSSTHEALLGLMKELGVKTAKRRSAKQRKTFFYEGRAVEDKAFQRRVFREAKAALTRIVEDEKTLRAAIAGEDLGTLRRYDTKTLGAYLKEIKAPKILRAYVKAVIDSESGRDHRELSSVVLFECLSVDLKARRFSPLPDEDEVYKIAGGAGAITAALEKRHGKSVALSHRLTAIDSDDGKLFKLTFATPEGERVVEVDHVILAIPPPALQGVAVRTPGWTDRLQQAVEGVRYGSHMKLTLFFKDRPWRKRGHAGGGFFENGYAFWESSEGQRTKAGSITFLGRAPQPGGKTAGQLGAEFLEKLARLFPGLKKSWDGVDIETWTRSYPFADGPGDPYGFVLTWLGRRKFTKFDASPLGNLRWAGDLYSANSPAYMSGAVETAKTAARAIVEAISKKKKPSP